MTQEEAQPMIPAQEAESELVSRLRANLLLIYRQNEWVNIGPVAADTIETLASLVSHWQIEHELERERATRLEAALREAREALEPFKLAADMADDRMLTRFLNTDLPDDTTVLGALNLTLGHLRIARTAFGGGV